MATSETPGAAGKDPTIIVALDCSEPASALRLADRLDARRTAVKVGLELFTAAGADVVRALVAHGFRVFLDLKFHDIPNTVAHACAAAVQLRVWMMNVHASGGRAMLEAARAAVHDGAARQAVPRPLLVAVRVLTSLKDDDLAAMRLPGDAAGQALHLARLAHACGLDGVVCSGVEAPALRAALPRPFRLVTPGIRPADSAADDQARVMTPARALANGADHLVIGRPISQAPDPAAALAAIEASLEGPAA
jgi:orotidine-5'-phosphate decarboxylase